MFHLKPEYAYLKGKVLSSRVYPEFFPLHKDERVLNVGFGDGPQALVYAGHFREMVGVEIQEERLARAKAMLFAHGMDSVELIQGNVEHLPFSDEQFDAVLAIDIAEHVQNPDAFFRELYRSVKPGGRLLITFPAMHDKFEDAMTVVGKILKPWKKRAPHDHGGEWHPDAHAHEHPFPVWRGMVEAAGFRFTRSRATTMFPPLHLYGIPRFWFSVEWIHALDRRITSTKLQKFGQTIMAEFVKPT